MSQAVERTDVTDDSSSSTAPDCRGLGSSPVLGQLPEMLPASLMTHQAFQQFQLQLLPFQVGIFLVDVVCAS